MTSPSPWLIAAALMLTAPTGAQALCSYNDELYARTTIAQEFADAPWVIRGRLVSVTESRADGIGDDEEPWTLYRVRIVQRYKGDPPVEISVFTYRNSGGFYMDRPGEGPDIGGEYLLFLQPTAGLSGLPEAARGGAIVNYSCGQSKPWAEVPTAGRSELAGLAGTIGR